VNVIPLTAGYEFHTEVREETAVDVVGFLRFKTKETKRTGQVFDSQGTCMQFCKIDIVFSLDEAEATRQIQQRLDEYLAWSAAEAKRWEAFTGKIKNGGG